MEEKKTTPQQEAEQIRKNFARRKNECVEVSVKLKQSIGILEAILKMDDVNDLGENGLGRVNVHDYVWNILVWYPRHAVPFFVEKLIPLYDNARKLQTTPHPLVAWLSRHVTDPKFFRFLIRLFPDRMTKDILRIRSIDKILKQLVHVEAMHEERADGKPLNVNAIAKFVSYLHVVCPDKTSEIVGFTLELYKQCQKINANQIKGFSGLLSRSKKTRQKEQQKNGKRTNR